MRFESTVGEYKDHMYEIVKRQLNVEYYCGYVRLNSQKERDAITVIDEDWGEYYDIHCHGGITFDRYASDYDVDEDRDTGKAFWIGFDCNHLDDSIEKQDFAYAEDQCKSIIDQILEHVKEETK